ncbi:MAG: cupin domain-containing protein [Chloroflexi bacterium]|nr:cupin domain-containing protein [Chloroflexota bacterium]MBU1749017.1 cupin domain-containing protein [Chloroflexota bacterium]
MQAPVVYTKHTFQGYSGYLVTPDTAHELVVVRHSASVPPWTDPDVHLHERSEEYYLLLQGELRFLVAGSLVTLRPQEMLVVQPQVSHAIVGGVGPIEHFGFRAPAPSDRQTVGVIPAKLPPVSEEESRELRREWGYRIQVDDAGNRNCWLTGLGAARFHSPHFLLAYLDFPTEEEANAGLGTRHRLHLHARSWEYYVVLQGTKTLRIEDELVTMQPGEMVEVPPGVRHTLHSRQAPYRGLTFRVPILPDKVEF